jgi:hypothetical protein
MKLVPDDYPKAECAKDLEAGFNRFGDTGDEAMDAMLAKGQIVMMPCPACTEAGKPHMLTVTKGGGKFSVTA